MMNKALVELSESDTVIHFIEKYRLTLSLADDCLYLFNDRVVFEIYLHLDTLYFDICDPIGKQWGWGVDSIIQELLSPDITNSYDEEADKINLSIDGIEKKQLSNFIGSVLILENELSDLLNGVNKKYSEFFQPMTESQEEEISKILQHRSILNQATTNL